MQYSNSQSIRTTTTVTKAALGILTVLLMLPILGSFPALKSLSPAFFVLWLIVVLFALFGGIDELYITLGHGWVEILKSRFISTTSHRQVVISTNEANIVKVRYYRFLFIRIARITYKKHDDVVSNKYIGLTMVERKKRHEFIRELNQICKRNNDIQ